MTHTLEVDSIFLSYKYGQQLVTDCYLYAETGDIIGVLGRNGCGKSSLLKIIFGTLRPSNKFIRIDGKVYQQPYKHGMVGYLPQPGFLPPNASVKSIIRLMLPDDVGQERLMTDSRLAGLLQTRAGALSGGERKYLEVLLLLNGQNAFVLLDEPFSGVEPRYKDLIKEVIREASARKGIVCTDHDYRNILDVSKKIMLITNGACKPINELTELEFWSYVPEGTFSKNL